VVGRGRPAHFLQGAIAALLLLIAACDSSESERPANTPIIQAPRTATLPIGSGFDFYVLSLSWSPSYCEAEGEDANRQQCQGGRPYAFVVHGLWPQFDRGYPQDCRTSEADVDRDSLRELYEIMPSAGLIRHQWKKHGSCAGLSQDDYFQVLRAARDKIAIPPEFARLEAYRTVKPSDVEASFLQSNPGMSGDGMAVTCDRRLLREVRICLTKQLDFRDCREVDRRSCRRSKAVMPPVRGN
jgi:ribonuclease T2